MAGNTRLPVKSNSEDRALESIFGPAPILGKEDAEAYHALLARVTQDVKPKDIFEEIFVREMVDLTWESFRWRRLMTTLLDSGDLFWQDIEPVDRLATTTEARRNGALRELERHRLSAAQNLRQAINEAEEAEFKVVEHKSVASNPSHAA